LREWIDFLSGYEDADAMLPASVRSPEVLAYLDRRCATLKEGHRHVRASLRLLLEGADTDVRRLGAKPMPDSALFEQLVPGYLTFARQHRGLRSSRTVESVLRGFFAWLDDGGGTDITDIGVGTIRNYLTGLTHLKRSTVASRASVLRCFFRYLGMYGVVRPALALAIESPRLYRMSVPPPVLERDTVERLLAATDRTTAIGKRDHAILLLAARYGMRPSDIRELRIDNILWREQRIVLVQSKTQRPLELPLLSDVDVALVDYLRNGRPACDARRIFLRHSVPVAPLVKSNNLWPVMARAFKAAGIEPPTGRRGLYLLRHSAATRMLSQGVPFDTISDVLGHASADTTRIYAQVDLAGLRSVALSAGEVWG
jgi:integrase